MNTRTRELLCGMLWSSIRFFFLSSFCFRFNPYPCCCVSVGFPYIIPLNQSCSLTTEHHKPVANIDELNGVGGFRPLTHQRTCHWWHTAVSRRVIGLRTTIPAATLLSLFARYPNNSPAPLRGFGRPPFHPSIKSSYILAPLGSAATGSEIWVVVPTPKFIPSHRGCSS